MYKAGDFTNGKMNEIFKLAARVRGDTARNHVDIVHKQLGTFTLVSEEQFAVTSMCMLAALKGVSISSIFGDIDNGTHECNELQMVECCTYLNKTINTWSGIFFSLVGICHTKLADDAGVLGCD